MFRIVMMSLATALGSSGLVCADPVFKDVFQIVHRRLDGQAEVTLLKKDEIVIQGKVTQIDLEASQQFLADLKKAIPSPMPGDRNCLPNQRWEVTWKEGIRHFCRNAAALRFLDEFTGDLRVLSNK